MNPTYKELRKRYENFDCSKLSPEELSETIDYAGIALGYLEKDAPENEDEKAFWTNVGMQAMNELKRRNFKIMFVTDLPSIVNVLFEACKHQAAIDYVSHVHLRKLNLIQLNELLDIVLDRECSEDSPKVMAIISQEIESRKASF